MGTTCLNPKSRQPNTTTYLAVSLFLLSLLLSQAQGIRLEKGVFSAVKQQNKNINEDNTVSTKTERTAASGVISKDCGHDDHCSSSGSCSSRKLITAVTSSTTTTTTSKNEKNIVGFQVSNPKFQSSATDSDKHHGKEKEVATTQQLYLDVIDINQMDYSPAKRKPPIHN